MTTFPANDYLTNASRTEGEFKSGLENFLKATKQLVGGSAATNLVIASGSITPTGARHTIDTEGSTATDDLTNIDYTNLPDGSLLILQTTNSGRDVTLKHSAGGSGQIILLAAADVVLSTVEDMILLERVGTAWYEVARLGKWAQTLIDGKTASDSLTALGITAFIKTLLDDSDAVTARTTLGLDLMRLTRVTIATTQTIPTEHIGKHLHTYDSPTLTLPLFSSTPDGSVVFISCYSGTTTIARNGSEALYTTASVTSFELEPGDFAIITKSGTAWIAAVSKASSGAGSGIVAAYFEPGSYTWTVPEDGNYYILGCGAGAGVCPLPSAANYAACGGGGGGAWGLAKITGLTKGETKSVSVGAGGIAGTTLNGHTAGGNTAFGGTHTMGGGGKATAVTDSGYQPSAGSPGGTGGALTGTFLLSSVGLAGGSSHSVSGENINGIAAGDYGRCLSPLNNSPIDASFEDYTYPYTTSRNAQNAKSFGYGASGTARLPSVSTTGAAGNNGFLLILRVPS